jgi:hypothetical protein
MNDHAVLVGITNYPGIQDLKGAVNDVLNFEKWLLNPAEGNVDKKKILKFITDLSQPPLTKDKIDIATPSEGEVVKKLMRIVMEGKMVMSDEYSDDDLLTKEIYFYRDENTGIRYLGRRLYFFLSGHGFSEATSPNDASLLMADGDYNDFISNHINGVKYVEWFQAAAYFKEIVLMMDCCRTTKSGINSLMPFGPNKAPTGRPANCFYALSTSYEKISREILVDGQWQGAFTTLLLEALRSAKPDTDNNVKWEELKSYIWNNRTKYLPAGYSQEPQIRESNSKMTIVFTHLQKENKYPVLLNFPAEKIGKNMLLTTGKLVPVKNEPIDSEQIEIMLPIGLYQIIVEGNDSPLRFEVTGSQGTSITM